MPTSGTDLIPWLGGEFEGSPKPERSAFSVDLRRVGSGVRIVPQRGATEVNVWATRGGGGFRLDGTPVPLVDGRLALRLFGTPTGGWLLEPETGELPELHIVEFRPERGLLEPGTIPAPTWPFPGHCLVHETWPSRTGGDR